MRTLFNAINRLPWKKAFYFALLCGFLFFLLSGCKSRKVSTTVSRSNEYISSRQVRDTSSLSIDGSREVTDKNVTTNDTSSYEVVIITDTGSVTVTNGNFSGHAKSIDIKGKSHHHQQSDSTASSGSFSKNKETGHQVSANQQQTSQSNKTKTVATSSSIYPWIAVVLAVLIVVVAIYCYLKGINPLSWL